MRPSWRAATALGLLALSPAAAAHSFGRLYNLPVPIWLYLYGAAAALAASFLVVAWFAGSAAPSTAARENWRETPRLARLLPLLRALALGLLLLCIASGLWGTRNPYANFNMTFFWISFVLGLGYFSALAGDVYAQTNAWQTLALGVAKVLPRLRDGAWRYPEKLGYWPALALYMGFIWVELFGATSPFSLALLLLVYTGISLAGALAFGARDWFRYGDFFGVLFRLIAWMSPVVLDSGARRMRLQLPFAGLLDQRVESMSLLLFVLFMLSSTAFDGLRETVPWVRLFWVDVFDALKPWVGDNPVLAFPVLRPLYLGWQTFWLLCSPFVYLLVYLAFLALSRTLAGSDRPLRELALRFAPSLLPIALVYNVTHYYTLVLTQGLRTLPLMSDPFGKGWNLLGTAQWFRGPIIPDAGWVWHTQVGLIVLGHIVSVYLAHVEALRLFPTTRQATLSQLPMLALMMLFTTAGLWILAQPIQSGM